MFDHEIQPILLTSPTTERLQFFCINISSLGFTVYNLYLNTTIHIATLPKPNNSLTLVLSFSIHARTLSR